MRRRESKRGAKGKRGASLNVLSPESTIVAKPRVLTSSQATGCGAGEMSFMDDTGVVGGIELVGERQEDGESHWCSTRRCEPQNKPGTVREEGVGQGQSELSIVATNSGNAEGAKGRREMTTSKGDMPLIQAGG